MYSFDRVVNKLGLLRGGMRKEKPTQMTTLQLVKESRSDSIKIPREAERNLW